jgi:hypothetical protein
MFSKRWGSSKKSARVFQPHSIDPVYLQCFLLLPACLLQAAQNRVRLQRKVETEQMLPELWVQVRP